MKQTIKTLLKKSENTKGITLIALVISIIIIIILAAIALNGALGQNGLINRSKVASLEYKKSEYQEDLNITRVDVDYREQKDEKDWDDSQWLDAYQEEIEKHSLFEDATIERKNDEENGDRLEVETKEGFLFEVRRNGIEYLGQSDGTHKVLVTDLKLNLENTEVMKTLTVKLEATIEPEDATNKELSWSSDNDGIATVSEDGTVTGVEVGTAKITATTKDGSKKQATCEVKVIPNEEEVNPEIGDYIDFKPSENSYEISKDISGTSDNQTISTEKNLKWRVFKNESNTITLISDPTAGTVDLTGALGYDNGVYILNNIAKNCYSSKYNDINTRYLTIEDLLSVSQYKPTNYVFQVKYGSVYNMDYSLCKNNSLYLPTIYDTLETTADATKYVSYQNKTNDKTTVTYTDSSRGTVHQSRSVPLCQTAWIHNYENNTTGDQGWIDARYKNLMIYNGESGEYYSRYIIASRALNIYCATQLGYFAELGFSIVDDGDVKSNMVLDTLHEKYTESEKMRIIVEIPKANYKFIKSLINTSAPFEIRPNS